MWTRQKDPVSSPSVGPPHPLLWVLVPPGWAVATGVGSLLCPEAPGLGCVICAVTCFLGGEGGQPLGKLRKD